MKTIHQLLNENHSHRIFDSTKLIYFRLWEDIIVTHQLSFHENFAALLSFYQENDDFGAFDWGKNVTTIEYGVLFYSNPSIIVTFSVMLSGGIF